MGVTYRWHWALDVSSLCHTHPNKKSLSNEKLSIMFFLTNRQIYLHFQHFSLSTWNGKHKKQWMCRGTLHFLHIILVCRWHSTQSAWIYDSCTCPSKSVYVVTLWSALFFALLPQYGYFVAGDWYVPRYPCTVQCLKSQYISLLNHI